MIKLKLKVEEKHRSRLSGTDYEKAWIECIGTLEKKYGLGARTHEGLLQQRKWLVNFCL